MCGTAIGIAFRPTMRCTSNSATKIPTAAMNRSHWLVADYPKWLPTIQVPASVGNLLEYRLGEAGTRACGFAVAVSYYLAQLEYPDAAHTLLNCVARAGELSLPTEALANAAQVTRGQVDKQVEGSEEVASLVGALERQYDDMTAGRGGGLWPRCAAAHGR